MCTAVCLTTNAHYFGRNLDLEFHYDENVVITPRRFPLAFRKAPALREHLAMIGVATVCDGYPLYYDATNECGVSMAGLSFSASAAYLPADEGADNIAPYEFIPWVLGQCRDMAQVRALLLRVRLIDEPFSDALPLSKLHWMIAWREDCVVVEMSADGLRVYDNPIGVLTNNPPFPMQKNNLERFGSLVPGRPQNADCEEDLPIYMDSNGLGALGLPGDWSSASRFVRASFVRKHSLCEQTEESSVSQFFRILAAVAMPRGSVMVGDKPEITVYASCCNADTGVYYYTTYENTQPTAVCMRREELDRDALTAYPLRTSPQFCFENG